MGGDNFKITKASTRGAHRVVARECSLLNWNFNWLWARALNGTVSEKYTHFAMQHDDIIPPEGWADVLIDELERTGADIISAVVPLKDTRGLTSTGVRDPETGNNRRLTMAELYQLPETFGLDDCLATGITAGPNPNLLIVNTGLWVCRFDRPWIQPGVFSGFQCADGIIRLGDGQCVAVCQPEDWVWSEWAHRTGLKVLATRRVPVAHLGNGGKEYRSDHVWGEWQTDHGD